MARRPRGNDKQVAAARVRALLRVAEAQRLGPDADLVPRYAQHVRALSLKHQLGLPSTMCRSCGSLALRTRLRAGRLVRTCLDCARVRRRPLGSP